MGEACVAIFLPTQRFKRRTFVSSGQRRYSCQWVKHAWLYSYLLQVLKGEHLSVLGSQQQQQKRERERERETLVSASTVTHGSASLSLTANLTLCILRRTDHCRTRSAVLQSLVLCGCHGLDEEIVCWSASESRFLRSRGHTATNYIRFQKCRLITMIVLVVLTWSASESSLM